MVYCFIVFLVFLVQDYIDFLHGVSSAIGNHKIQDITTVSDPVRTLLEHLETLSQWVDEVKPIDQEQRFGNVAYRDWYTKMSEVRTGQGLFLEVNANKQTESN